MCLLCGLLGSWDRGNGRFTYSPNATARNCVGAIWYLRSVSMEMWPELCICYTLHTSRVWMETADESVELQADPWGGQGILYGIVEVLHHRAKTNWKSKSSHTFSCLGIIFFSRTKKIVKIITSETENKMPGEINSILFLLLFHVRINGKKNGG